MGIAKAAVLPVPVRAWPTTSPESNARGISPACTGVGSAYPAFLNPEKSSSFSGSRSKPVFGFSDFDFDLGLSDLGLSDFDLAEVGLPELDLREFDFSSRDFLELDFSELDSSADDPFVRVALFLAKAVVAPFLYDNPELVST